MNARARRGGLVVAVVVALIGVAGCGTGGSAAGPSTSAHSPRPSPVASHPPDLTTTTPSDPDRPSATSSGGVPSASSRSVSAGVTSTPGLHLTGPQPLPAVAHLTPVRIRVPAIGVDSALEALRTKAGVLQPPADPLVAGWWSGGPVPGDPGPAVIAGHLDSYTGPAVFIHLSELRTGDLIDVTRSNGSTVVFVVDSVQVYEKSAFPTQAVYGATPGVALRLITCGGTFDRATQLYLANVIVYASLRT